MLRTLTVAITIFGILTVLLYKEIGLELALANTILFICLIVSTLGYLYSLPLDKQ